MSKDDSAISKLPSSHKRIVDFFVSANNKKLLHHAYGFFGPRGIGKSELAHSIAKTLVEAQGETDPDIVSQELPGDQEAKEIDTVREFIYTFSTTPLIHSIKIGIIANADLLSIQSQNTLLKTLEEPPENHYFFLTASSPRRLLQTIQSRIFNIRVPRISSTEIQALTKPFALSSEETALCASLSAGRPAFARQLCKNNEVKLVQGIVQQCSAFCESTLSPFLLADTIENGYKEHGATYLSYWIYALSIKLQTYTPLALRKSIIHITYTLQKIMNSKSTENLKVQLESSLLN